MISKKFDNFTIVSMTPEKFSSHKRFSKELTELRTLISSGRTRDKASIINNYSNKRFVLNEQTIISLLLVNNHIEGFSTLFNSANYPQGAFRCLNRFFLSQSVRSPFFKKGMANLIGPEMIRQQLSLIDCSLVDFFFISKEAPKLKWSGLLSKNLTKHTQLFWNHDSFLYPVCNRESRYCWQHIVYTKINCQSRPLHPFEGQGISYAEYKNRFF